MNPRSTVFQRLILPGFALRAVVIAGGYATGRELATFFLPSGPRGGLYGMVLSMLIWSVVCALTFVFALQTHSLDYRTFFRHLLGRFWPVFEVSFALAILVILAAYAAAAGAMVGSRHPDDLRAAPGYRRPLAHPTSCRSDLQRGGRST